MEPDKFEKHIKNELSEREISPSDNAWDKISNHLPTPKEPKSNRYFWYSVAAVFAGILLISSLYFNTSDESIESGIQIVETPKETISTPKNKNILVEKNVTEDKIAVSQKAILKESDRPKVKVESTININSQITSTGSVQDKVKKADAVPNGTEQLINAKIAEIVAQVNQLENSNLPVSSIEVDSLLRQAQREILTDKIFNQEGKVNAMALLNEVEGELDQTFREQIFETLKVGFLKVRTAVADRNN